MTTKELCIFTELIRLAHSPSAFARRSEVEEDNGVIL